MNELKLDEYSFMDSEKPFSTITFKYDGYSKINFTIRPDEIYMSVDDGIPIEAVEEAIKIVKSRTLEF
jgi:hypothetical protein